MARSFGMADGRSVAKALKNEAQETLPDDPQGQAEYILGGLLELLANNKSPHGKPWTATFWRGLGKELK